MRNATYLSGLAATLLLMTGCNRAESGGVLNESTVENRYELEAAKADADRRVALEQCEALSGSSQQACRDSAESQYELTVAGARRGSGQY